MISNMYAVGFCCFPQKPCGLVFQLTTYIEMVSGKTAYKLNACEKYFVRERIYTEKKSYKYNECDF